MKITVFASLKEYFGNELELNEEISDINKLQQRLTELNPSAENILNISRFAVGDEFIGSDYKLSERDSICIIPPSSGG